MSLGEFSRSEVETLVGQRVVYRAFDGKLRGTIVSYSDDRDGVRRVNVVWDHLPRNIIIASGYPKRGFQEFVSSAN